MGPWTLRPSSRGSRCSPAAASSVASPSSCAAWAATGRRPGSPTRRPRRSRSIAAGEVRISGVIEPAELTLVSLLQSVPCVYYRATIGEDDDEHDAGRGGVVEERAVGFRVRDATGELRVFPRDAPGSMRPIRFDGLDRHARRRAGRPRDADRRGRSGRRARPRGARSTTCCGSAIRATAPCGPSLAERRGARRVPRGPPRAGRRSSRSSGGRSRSATCAIPTGADIGSGADAVGVTIRRSPPTSPRPARRATLADDPDDAWGNAAIPGFGIGRPIRPADDRPGREPAAPRRCRGRGGPRRADVRDRARDARRRGLGRGPAAHRPRHARARRPSAIGTASSSACSGPSLVDRLGDGPRDHARWRVRVVNAPRVRGGLRDRRSSS